MSKRSKLGRVNSTSPAVLHFAHGISRLRQIFGEYISRDDREQLIEISAEPGHREYISIYRRLYQLRKRVRLPVEFDDSTEEQFWQQVDDACL